MEQHEGGACHRCLKDLQGALSFSFKAPARLSSNSEVTAATAIVKCFACSLLHRPMLKRSAMAALFVGTVLTLLNQGDLLLAGQWNGSFYWKIPLTFCVPFIVATYGALTNNRR